jgi:hypothetical protein
LPVARELGDTSLMLLVHPTIAAEQIAVYAAGVRSVVKKLLGKHIFASQVCFYFDI